MLLFKDMKNYTNTFTICSFCYSVIHVTDLKQLVPWCHLLDKCHHNTFNCTRHSTNTRVVLENRASLNLLTRNRYLKLFLIGLKSAPMDPFVIATHRLCHLASLFHSRLACSLECVLCYGKRLIGLLMAHRVSLSFSGHWEV